MAKTCMGKTITGADCRAAAGESGLCFFHAHPEAAKKLGRLGGQKNRRSLAVDLHVPDTIDAHELSKLNVQVMRMLLSGELPPREAMAFVQLSNSHLRLIQSEDLEARSGKARERTEPRLRTSFRCSVTVASASEVAVRQVAGDISDVAAQREDVNSTDANPGAWAADQEAADERKQ